MSGIKENDIQSNPLLYLDNAISKINMDRFINSIDFEHSINKQLEGLSKLLGASRGYIYIFDRSISYMDNTYEWYACGVDARPIPEYATKPLADKFLHIKNETSSSIVLPIIVDKLIIGCIGLDFLEPSKEVSKENITVIKVLCDIYSGVIAHNQKVNMLSMEAEKFRELFHHENDIVILNDVMENGAPGPIIEANEAACKKLGYKREEILQKDPQEIGRLDTVDNLENISKALFRGEPVSYELIFTTKTGDSFPVEISARLFELTGKRVVLTVARDITEQKRVRQTLIENNSKLTEALEELKLAQKQLLRQEKLASIGQLAAGIAHEINNPLGFVSSNVETARIYLNEFIDTFHAYKNLIRFIPESTPEAIESRIKHITDLEEQKDLSFIADDFENVINDIEAGLNRITEIIMSLKAFSRLDQSLELNEYDLNKSIKNALLIANNDIKYHSIVKLNLGDIPHIEVCGSKIDQVLLNIILNSSQAIKEKKAWENKVNDMQKISDGSITITTDMKDNYVRCMIEDNGIGIEDKYMSKILDPFFTTKPIGEGTGLGLSIAYDIIVNQHNGQLLIESVPMVGTRITIILPVSIGHHEAGN